MQLLGISHEQANDIAQKVSEGQEAIKPGWVRLDTNFIFSKYELEYIVKAIELIALHAEKMMGFYVQEPSGQWNINFGTPATTYVFGMAGVLQAPQESPEFELSQRKQLLATQIEQGAKILEDPYQFLYSLKHNGLVDVRDRVKQMFNRNGKTAEEPNKSPNLNINRNGDSIKKSTSQYSMNIESINEETDEYLMRPNKLTVFKNKKKKYFITVNIKINIQR